MKNNQEENKLKQGFWKSFGTKLGNTFLGRGTMKSFSGSNEKGQGKNVAGGIFKVSLLVAAFLAITLVSALTFGLGTMPALALGCAAFGITRKHNFGLISKTKNERRIDRELSDIIKEKKYDGLEINSQTQEKLQKLEEDKEPLKKKQGKLKTITTLGFILGAILCAFFPPLGIVLMGASLIGKVVGKYKYTKKIGKIEQQQKTTLLNNEKVLEKVEGIEKNVDKGRMQKFYEGMNKVKEVFEHGDVTKLVEAARKAKLSQKDLSESKDQSQINQSKIQ